MDTNPKVTKCIGIVVLVGTVIAVFAGMTHLAMQAQERDEAYLRAVQAWETDMRTSAGVTRPKDVLLELSQSNDAKMKRLDHIEAQLDEISVKLEQVASEQQRRTEPVYQVKELVDEIQRLKAEQK